MSSETNRIPYKGDLDKTKLIDSLLTTPRENRSEQWTKQFLEYVPLASFRCGDPQVIKGPDGFLYFQLLIPEPDKAFQCYVVHNMKDDFLLTNGFGVVIMSNSGTPEWVFTHGDIVNYHLNGVFYTEDDQIFSKKSNDETLPRNEQVMIGQPAETLLPKVTRELLSGLLKSNGLTDPKVLIMARKNESGATSDLVFNITPDSFPDPEMYKSVFRVISWYLPRHYSIVGMSEESLPNGFLPL